MPNGKSTIDKLDFPDPPVTERTRLLRGSQSVESLGQPSQHSIRSGRFFEDVAEGVQDRDRQRLKRELTRYVSFAWAIVCCGCAGSITAFSLYGPLFLSRLHYTQYRVNLVSILAEGALYLPLAIVGFINDRYGPRFSCLLAAVLFGLGYLLAAFTYKSGPPSDTPGGHGWPFPVMVFAFICIGLGTSCLHLGGLTTCTKNLGRGKYRGIAVSAPIAAFGLSGFWQSQVGSRLLYERAADGSVGDLDVFRFFIFLASLLTGVGIIGFLTLRIVDEDELIEEAIEELERSGFLDDNEFFRTRSREHNYGTVSQDNNHLSEEEETERSKRLADDGALKKTMLLNAETKRFLTDQTMWWLAAGFFLVTGPGEAYINNLGTILYTLYHPPVESDPPPLMLPLTTPATHVSILAITSTLARLISGAVSDIFAPPMPRHQPRGSASLTSSLASLDPLTASTATISKFRRCTVSRMPFLLGASLILSVGFALLASGAVQYHAAERFWIVTAAVGLGYGSVFTLVPVIISCVWGVENFGTNFGVVAMAPAFGAAVWGVIYSAEYEAGRKQGGWKDACYGKQCYRITFWGMAAAIWVACTLWMVAWRGPRGWKKKGIAV